MAALTEYALKTAQDEYILYRTRLQDVAQLGVLTALLGTLSAWTIPHMLTDWPIIYAPAKNGLLGTAVFLYFVCLPLAWGAFFNQSLPLLPGKSADYPDVDQFIFEELKAIARDNLRGVPIELCPPEVQSIAHEILRLQLIDRLREKLPKLRKSWQGRVNSRFWVLYLSLISLAAATVDYMLHHY